MPPEAPEPTLGINFARDGMRVRGAPRLAAPSLLARLRPEHVRIPPPQRRDWLSLIAVHSDTWLLAVTFYKAARFNAEQRYVAGIAAALS